MEFHLQNARTGETTKLSPDRTLIGTADHAQVQTEGGPYLAALAVRYGTNWTLYGLSDDNTVTVNRRPLQAVDRVILKRGDLLVVGTERFTFIAPGREQPASTVTPPPATVTPACFAYIQNPDGMEECRAVDHDLLFGRLPICHVQLADSRLSRLSALLACADGAWYIHTLSKKPLGRNRKPVTQFARVEDGDELLIGPLVVRLEIRPPTAERPPLPSNLATNVRRSTPVNVSTDFGESTDDGSGDHPTGPDLSALRECAERLEEWLKGHPPVAAAKGGFSGWLESQRDRLRRFWYDTPETTAARSLRTKGSVQEAFDLLDRAIRARPDGPELLRELYRLYESVGFHEFCFRPLRQIEKIAETRGAPDAWVLETLARLCERLSTSRPSMADRAINYWNKLEAATGVSYSRERSDFMARRALREGGYAGASGDGI